MESLGPYRIVDELARGGMGAVYRARHTVSSAEVALKVLLHHAAPDATARRRFVREAKALARLQHPGIVRVHDVGEQAGRLFLAMELVEGTTLQARLERGGPLPVSQALELTRALCEALAHAHAQGILHRDLKPANVLLDRQGRPRLTDFGLAKDLVGSTSGSLSVAGTFMGTPGYWPPEQARGELDQVGPRSDVYGLGALLHAMLTGEPPHGEPENLIQAVGAVLREPEPPSRLAPHVPAAVDALVLRCLALDPRDRFPSAGALADALAAAARAVPVRSVQRTGSRGPLLAAAALVVTGVVAAWLVVAGASGSEAPDALAAQADRTLRGAVLQPDYPALRAQRQALDAAIARGAPGLTHWRALTLHLLDAPGWEQAARDAAQQPGRLGHALELLAWLQPAWAADSTDPDLVRLEALLGRRPGPEDDPWWSRSLRFQARHTLARAGRLDPEALVAAARLDRAAEPDDPVFAMHLVQALLGLASAVPARRPAALDEAEALIAEASRRALDSPQLLILRGALSERRLSALVAQGGDAAAVDALHERAVTDLRRAAQLDPVSRRALRLLAAFLAKRGRMTECAAVRREVLDRSDDDPRDWSHLVLASRYAQRWDALPALLDTLTTRFPDSRDTWEVVTRVELTRYAYFRQTESLAQAAVAATRYQALTPGRHDPQGWLALVRHFQADPDWDRDLPASPDASAPGWLIAEATRLRERELLPALDRGGGSGAVEIANRCLALLAQAGQADSYGFWSLYQLSTIWSDMVTRFDPSAWSVMERAHLDMLPALPLEVLLHERLVSVQQLPAHLQATQGIDPRRYLGDDPRTAADLVRASRELLTRSLELSPTRAVLWKQRGYASLLLNEPQAALADLRRCVELSPDDATARNLLETALRADLGDDAAPSPR